MKLKHAPFVIAIVCASSPAVATSWPTEPDPAITKGAINEKLSLTDICTTKWGTDARFVTARMKQQVIDAYHFDARSCPLTLYKGKRLHRVEIDHLIPRSLGGADDVANLWPECYEVVTSDKNKQADGAHKKDRLETKLHKDLCAAPSKALLEEDQAKIKTGWLRFYHETYPNE